MTETPILDEGAVEEIEARWKGRDLNEASWDDVSALCATVKHLRAELANVRDELRVADDALENQSQWMSEFRAQRESLQSQLEQLRAGHQESEKQLREWQDKVVSLMERLAQVEQELARLKSNDI